MRATPRCDVQSSVVLLFTYLQNLDLQMTATKFTKCRTGARRPRRTKLSQMLIRQAIYAIPPIIKPMYFSTLIAVFASTLYAQLGVSALWPQPQQYQPGTKFMKLAPNFIINFTYGLENPVWDLDCMESPSSLCNLLFQTLYTLKMPNATQRVPQRLVSAADLDKDKQALQSAPQLSVLYLRYPNQDTRNLPEDELWHIFTTMDQRKQAEAYQLSVSLNGTAVITANSSLGMLRGLATFAQLWYINSDNDIYTVEAPVDIADSPAYVSLASY